MNNIERIDNLINDLQTLQFKQEDKLDAILRRTEMILRNIFGSDSKYLKDLSHIRFSKPYLPVSEKQERDAWNSGTSQLLNILSTAKEELELFMTSSEGKSETETNSVPTTNESFVDLSRIDELRNIKSPSFDLVKLIRLCEELNICYAQECFLSVTMLTRAILDHVPPIFNSKNFDEVANNYGGKSFKKSMQNLQNSSRNIADANLHMLIRDKETLPTKVQVNFHNDLDVLLQEIVRILK